MSTIVARLYYNPSYQVCEDKPCYFIYIPNGGSFVSTPEDTYKTLDTPTFDLVLQSTTMDLILLRREKT